MVNLKKLNAMQEATQSVKSEKADLKAQPKKKKVVVKRTERMATYLTKSEKDKFLSMIGRTSESDALRELILKAIKEK